ncbi:MAG: ion transporter [Tenuifilaceae bacterium]
MKMIFNLAQVVSNSKSFKVLIFILIIVSAVIVGIETYHDIALKYRVLLTFIDSFIVFCFTIEIIVKILAMGKRPWDYFTDPWNVFDFLIVAVCLIPNIDTHYVVVLRIVRVLRVLRMITFLPKLRLLIGALLKSIPSMGYVLMLITLLFYIYAILGVFLFGVADPMHFGDLIHAMVTLFKVLTLEGWTDIMNTHIYGPVSNGNLQLISIWPFLYFASFILIGAMIIMNLFIGVIMNSMQESQNDMVEEILEAKSKTTGSEELFNRIASRLDELQKDIQNLKRLNNK